MGESALYSYMQRLEYHKLNLLSILGGTSSANLEVHTISTMLASVDGFRRAASNRQEELREKARQEQQERERRAEERRKEQRRREEEKKLAPIDE